MSHLASLVSAALVQQPLSVRARVVDGTRRRYRLELRVGSKDEEPRIIENDDCQKLAEATAIIVSLDLQSRARSERSATEARTGETPPSDVRSFGTPQPSAPPRMTRSTARDAQTRERGNRLHGGLGVELSGDTGTFPKLAWGGGVRGFLAYGAFRGELGATLWPRSETTRATPLGGGASVSLRTLALGGCMVWPPSLELSGCIRLEGGSMHATGFGISRPSWSDGLWLAGFVGIAARPFRWGALSPRANVELGTPLNYSAVEIERVGRVFTPSPLLLRFGVCVETNLF